MINVSSEIIINWWDYYLLKWGIKKTASIYANTKPDAMQLTLSRDIVRYHKSLVKAIFRLIKEARLEYYRQPNEMVIYTKSKSANRRLKLEFMDIETVEKLLDLHLNFQLFDPDLFIVEIARGTKILVRRNIVSDIVVVAETIIQNEYGILKPFLLDAVVLDIGAYIGDSAIKFILEGAKHVYSYEPHPQLYKLADQNIKLNNLGGKITLKNFGVSDNQNDLTIKEDNLLGASGVFGLTNYQRCKNVTLKLLPLDSIIPEIGNIDVRKWIAKARNFRRS